MYSFNTNGKNLIGNSGSVNYSIGQVFFSNFSDNTHQIAEGIQVGYQENIEENIKNEDSDIPEDSSIDVVVYPNPATNLINLVSDGLTYENSLNSYQLYDYQGKLLKQNIIQQTTTQIDLTKLNASLYLLQVFVEQKLWKTFKIVKN